MKDDNIPFQSEAPQICEDDRRDIRILRRVWPLETFPCAPMSDLPVRRVAVIDVETTGVDVHCDEVFDIAVALITVDAAGRITGIRAHYWQQSRLATHICVLAGSFAALAKSLSVVSTAILLRSKVLLGLVAS